MVMFVDRTIKKKKKVFIMIIFIYGIIYSTNL